MVVKELTGKQVAMLTEKLQPENRHTPEKHTRESDLFSIAEGLLSQMPMLMAGE
jgi:hypothetical protein